MEETIMRLRSAQHAVAVMLDADAAEADAVVANFVIDNTDAVR